MDSLWLSVKTAIPCLEKVLLSQVVQMSHFRLCTCIYKLHDQFQYGLHETFFCFFFALLKDRKKRRAEIYLGTVNTRLEMVRLRWI